jgi:CHASE3 domain sensor protein
MAVAMVPRDKESWNDDRLGDLEQTVDGGFKEMREEFRAMRSELKEEMGALRSENAATNRVVAQVSWATCGTMLVGFLSVVATILATS